MGASRGLPWLGLGLSSNLSARGRPHPWRLLDARPGAFDYVEYSAPLALDAARAQAPLFDELRARRGELPALFHPVHLNLWGPEPEDEAALRDLAEHARAVGSPWVSNDVGWWHAAGRFFPGYLYVAPPFTREAVADCAVHVQRVQAVLDRPLAVENPVVIARRGGLHVLRFLAELHARTRAPLVLDLGHLFAHQLSAGLPPDAGLDDFPLDAVIEIHLAGGLVTTRAGRGFYADAHSQPVREELFELLEAVAPRCPALRAVTYEADGHPEAVAALHLERLRRVVPPRGARPEIAEPPAPDGEPPPVPEVWASRPWRVFEEAFGGDPAEDPEGAEAERDLRLSVLAEELDRAFPWTRLLVAGTPEALRRFAASEEWRDTFRPPGREPARSFARHARRALRETPDDAAATALAFETWAHERLGRASAPSAPGGLALAPGVAFGVFPVDLSELAWAARAVRARLARAAEASGRFETSAFESLRQVAARAPRRPWPVALRSDRGRLEVVVVEPPLARVLEAAARGHRASDLAPTEVAALESARRAGLVPQ